MKTHTITQDLPQLTLKQFIKKNPDYICIDFNDNTLVGSAHNQWFYTEIELSQSVHYTTKKVTEINLHRGDTQNLLTLLRLNPSALLIDYWYENNSQIIKESGLNCESLRITGRTNKTLNPVIEYHNIHKTYFQRMVNLI